MEDLKLEHRSVIKFLTKEGIGPKIIHERMIAVYGENAPSHYQVKFWSKQFRWGRDSILDDPKPGRPRETRTQETVKKIEDLVLTDRRLKVSVIARELQISETTVLKILHEDLGMNKVSARWIPKLLTPEQKLVRREICQENLDALKLDFEFFSKIITGDETWVHHWDPPTKQESMQWVHKGSPPPKKAKLMATIFWDCEGILLVEYMQKGTTITGEVYKETIKNLKAAIQEKRPQNFDEKTILLHDNCRPHTRLKKLLKL